MECETIEWETNSGVGSSAFKTSRMLAMHDGQCRFDMKMVVVTVSGIAYDNLPDWRLAMGGDMLVTDGPVN
jgi:hypothetical protein